MDWVSAKVINLLFPGSWRSSRTISVSHYWRAQAEGSLRYSAWAMGQQRLLGHLLRLLQGVRIEHHGDPDALPTVR